MTHEKAMEIAWVAIKKEGITQSNVADAILQVHNDAVEKAAEEVIADQQYGAARIVRRLAVQEPK